MSWGTFTPLGNPLQPTQSVPTGTVWMTIGDEADEGWLLCNGAEYPQVSYPALYRKCGTKFNTGGETAGYFRVPAIKGRTVVGLDSTDTDFDTIGELRGAKTVTLTGAQSGLPAHAHTLDYQAKGSDTAGAYGFVQSAGAGTEYSTRTCAAANAAEAHSVVQPCIVLNHQIKT
jgi:microcystin-dependent protein